MCWGGSYTKDLCCNRRWGPNGLASCWGEGFSYDTCCADDPHPVRPGNEMHRYNDYAMLHFRDKVANSLDYLAWMRHADLYEFGVYVGHTLRVKTLFWLSEGLDFNSVYGFDSFHGLPTSDGMFSKGDYSARRYFGNSINDKRALARRIEATISDHPLVKQGSIHLIPGYFNKSLTDELPRLKGMRKAFWINIDVDLYSSALEALDWMFHHDLVEPGRTFIYLDDGWYYGKKGVVGELEALEFIKKKFGVATSTVLVTEWWDGQHPYLFRVESIRRPPPSYISNTAGSNFSLNI